MALVFGAPRPSRLVNAAAFGSFPRAASNYTSTSLIVPKTWGQQSWYPFATATQSAAQRGEIVGFGDSTLHGAGGLYSVMQRIRDRAVTAGLTDGGKGATNLNESEIGYDSPEVNSYVSSTGFAQISDNYQSNGNGLYWDDGTTANRTISFQFRATCCRLWYGTRNANGQFQYRVDGGTWTTIDAYQTSTIRDKFVYLSGLSAGTTHTIDVQNLATTPQNAASHGCHVMIAPMNATGCTVQKFAVTGQTFSNFNGTWRYWNALGLTEPSGPKDAAASYSIDATVTTGAVKPVLGWMHLGFNDLSSGAGAAAIATTGISYFAAACQAAGIDGVVCSGQLPYNANWTANGSALFTGMRDAAASLGLAWVDLFTPVAGPSQSYSSGVNNPHLTKTQYQTQADWIWDNLLGL